MTSSEIMRLTETIFDLNNRLRALELTPQLGNSSLENTALPVYDAGGNLTAIIGALPGGAGGTQIIDGPTPAAPLGVSFSGGPRMIEVNWTGEFLGAKPLDFSFVAIHASVDPNFVPTSSNTVATISAIEAATRIIPISAAGYFIKATTVSLADKRSDPTDESFVEVEELVDDKSITEALVAERTAREQAYEDVQGTFTDLDTRLGAFATDEALAPIRQALTDAQAAVEAAQGVAETANQAANAASQAALEAAGIANAKGRVIVQESEPTGADRNAANIWIRPIPDDPSTDVQEKAVTHVYIAASDEWQPTTSSELAQAAQNALDAREAAQQAQQRADTAVANAAVAQAAAEAAQRTADTATTDARAAHNEAVAAAEKAQASIEAGDSLVVNGSFEQGDLGWPAGGSHGGRSRIIEDPGARTGTHVLEITPVAANVYPESDFVAVEPGQVLRVRGWVKHLGGDGSRVGLLARHHDANKAYVRLAYAKTDTGVQDWTVGEWVLLEGEITVPEGVRWLRFAFHMTGPTTSTYHADDFQVVDVTEARRAQQRADAAYAEAEKKITAEQGKALADAAEKAAKEAAALDATAKAATAKAEATKIAADDAKAKADAAQAEATRVANSKATPEQVQAAAAEAERLAKEAAALDATAKANAAEARAATDAKNKADAALAAARADLAKARGEITAEIKASANGKNAIKISTAAPSASTPGVVVGDTWWRVDSSGNIFGQWRWTGSTWTPVQVRSEVIANLDVHKLQVTGSAKMAESVIEKLWVDGLAARAVETARLTVSSGNLIPDGTEMLSDAQWGPLTRDTTDKPENLPASRRTVPGQGNSNVMGKQAFPVTPGQEYVAEMWVKADKPGSHIFVEMRVGAHLGTTKLTEPVAKSGGVYWLFQNEPVPTEWTRYRGTWTPNAGVTEAGFGTFYFNHVNGTERGAQVWIAGLSMRPKVGAVLIEDGAISTDNLSADAVNSAKIAAGAVETAHMQANSIDGDRLRANSIMADKINATSVGAELITSGTLRTSATGERLEINKQGVVLYGANEDDGELVRLGPSGENLLTIGSSTVSDTSISADTGNYNQLSIGGQSIEEMLTQLPRGMRAWGRLTTDSQYDSDTGNYARRGELQTTLEPNRLYRIALSSHYIQTSYSTNTTAVEELRYSFDAVPIIEHLNPGPMTYRGSQYRHLITAGSVYLSSGQEFMLDTAGWTTNRIFWLMWLLRPEHGSASIRVLARDDYAPILSIEDMGPSMNPTLKRWNDGNGGGSQDTEPTVVRRTESWGNGGFGGDVSGGDVVQGQYGSYGNRSGGWLFPSSMRSALSGATIDSFEVYLYANHWYAGAGGTASIRPNDGSYKGFVGTAFTSANWPRNAGRWVKVPSSWHASIANGTYKGIGVQTSSTSLQYYGRFTGTATKFRATYRRG